MRFFFALPRTPNISHAHHISPRAVGHARRHARAAVPSKCHQQPPFPASLTSISLRQARDFSAPTTLAQAERFMLVGADIATTRTPPPPSAAGDMRVRADKMYRCHEMRDFHRRLHLISAPCLGRCPPYDHARHGAPRRQADTRRQSSLPSGRCRPPMNSEMHADGIRRRRQTYSDDLFSLVLTLSSYTAPLLFRTLFAETSMP